MPTLDELQRQWLDTALQSKGRFTRAASIKKDWEDYRRRRDKAVSNAAGLLPDDPQKILVENGLKAADKLAEAGKFADAYKALDAIKKMGASASKERAKAIAIDDIRVRLNILRSNIDTIVKMVDFARGYYDPLFDHLADLDPVSAKANIAEASRHLQVILQEEQVLRGELTGRHNQVYDAYQFVRDRKPAEQIADLERDIAVHISAGHQAEMRVHVQDLAALKQRANANNGIYVRPDDSVRLVNEKKAAAERELKRLKDMSKFRGDGGIKDGADQKTATARGKLEATTNLDWIELEEQDRIDRARVAMRRAGLQDKTLTTETKDGPVKRAPDLKKFDGAAVFDTVLGDVFGPNAEVPDDIPFDKAADIKTKARAQLKAVIAQLDPAGDELFDLMISTPEDLARMCNLQLAGLDSPKGLSESHKALLTQMADELRKEILSSSPNKMKDDGSEITVNGKVYTLEAVVGEGANGAVRRYTDGTKSFVVKSLKGGGMSDEGGAKFKSMADEMRTHRQVLQGSDDADTDTDNLVMMHGAAVSEDGSLHMMLEEAEGGDMATVGNNMLLMQNLGVLPDSARKALSLDLIAQSVKGLKALQERGLMHNDIKPQNIMINKDGTVKIIDFGESRFVDEQTGKGPQAFDGGYSTTPGYEAPEHYGKAGKGGIDSKADTFALGGIVKTLMDASMSEDAVTSSPKPVTAMGRLADALTKTKADERVSLDTVLMSSLLDQLQEDHNPDDVKDLQKTMSEMNIVMKDLKGQISAEEMNANKLDGKGMTDTLWLRYEKKVSAQGGEVPLSVIQTMPTKIDDALRAARDELSRAKPEDAFDLRDKIKKLEEKKKFWLKKISDNVAAQREEGKKEIEDAIDMKPPLMLKVPGEGGGEMTLKQALALRDDNRKAIKGLQDDFAVLSKDRPDMALNWLDLTNRQLIALDEQCKAIDAGLFDLLGPKGKYYITEQKLSEISVRFGPRKKSGEDIARDATPKPKPVVDEEDDTEGNSSREGGIPTPPPLPKDRKVNQK